MFNTIALFTTNNQKMVDFYCDIFGFETSWNGIDLDVEMRLGDMRILLTLHAPRSKVPAPRSKVPAPRSKVSAPYSRSILTLQTTRSMPHNVTACS